MSLYFYDAEESGPSVSSGNQRLEWRGDSEPSDSEIPLEYNLVSGVNLDEDFIEQYRDNLDPDGNGTVDLSGGFHDAGDHVKFGLPQSYAASTLGWGLYEFRDSFEATGSLDHALEELKWFTDYFLRSTFRDDNGDVIAFNYMVGDGSTDHNYWGPPELQLSDEFPRPASFAYEGDPASDQAAGAAAALTLMYLNYSEIDSDYADECLEYAKALYEFAVNNRGLGTDDGFYTSSYDEDEMSWAAVWLYIATDNTDYLDDIVAIDANGNYTGYLSKIISTTADSWQNIWVHSWDTVWGGVFAKLAPVSEGYVSDDLNDNFWYYFQWNLEYWTAGEVEHSDTSDTNYLTASPAGFSVINTWGSARYNTAAQLCALVYRKYAGETEKAIALTDWALSQMNYIMGDNPLEKSYIVGYGDSYVQHPHHRAAHGGEDNSMLIPAEHKHTLWGALAAGPDIDDYHNDDITDYVYNEVAIDYNAGFVGALAGFIEYYGEDQVYDSWEPEAEEEVLGLYSMAKLEQDNDERTQITLQLNNKTSQPPTLYDAFSLKYFFNISELIENGQSIDDVSYEIYYDESSYFDGAATVTGPIAWDATNGIYYMNIAWDGINIWGDMQIQFALLADQDSTWTAYWDSSNDWSMTDVTAASLDYSPYVPLYIDGELIYGSEPVISESSGETDSTENNDDSETIDDSGTTDGSGDTDDTVDSSGVPECNVDYSVVNEWSTGYIGSVTISNNGEGEAISWQTTITYSDNTEIVNSWQADVSGESPTYSASSQSWNGSIDAGDSVSWGFEASINDSYELPAVSVTCE
ncbi:glycoside hydrolase family 9 protein [Reinekea marinisedimentorum]|nr:glycoside hydrolase family 9 protein [Reinekea marinisedimentorum]